jgi:hypothetical protein
MTTALLMEKLEQPAAEKEREAAAHLIIKICT